MKIDLLFVESPLQFLNAYEAIKYFKLKNYILIIRYSNNDSNDRQIKKLLNIFNINICNIEEVTIATSQKSLLDLLKLILYKYKYIFRARKVNKVFIGNYNSGFFCLIREQFKKNKIILLDDGAKTIDIQRGFSEQLNYDLFTMYRIDQFKNQKIYNNKYEGIKVFFRKKTEIDNQKVLFLGAKLSEMMIVSEEYYIDLINKISDFYKDKKIIYIPHRDENGEKLKRIERIENIEIKVIDYPIELIGLFETALPKKVSSFYSTALLTMKNIYKIEAEAFYFDYKGSIHKNAIDSVYHFYKDEMSIIEL